jgi:hypothetical protein
VATFKDLYEILRYALKDKVYLLEIASPSLRGWSRKDKVFSQPFVVSLSNHNGGRIAILVCSRSIDPSTGSGRTGVFCHPERSEGSKRTRNSSYAVSSATKREAASYPKTRNRTLRYTLTPRFFGKLRMTSLINVFARSEPLSERRGNP